LWNSIPLGLKAAAGTVLIPPFIKINHYAYKLMAKYLIQPLLEGGGADMIPLNNLGDHVTVTLALIDIDIDTFIMINIINIKGWAI